MTNTTIQQPLIPKLRFPEFSGEWKNGVLSDLLEESKARNYDEKYSREQVLSVSGELGVVNQIKHLGRSYAGASIANYHILETNDIVYTKSPLKSNPYGIIKVNKGDSGVVSTLYAVYKLKNNTVGEFIDYYFQLDVNLNNYLRPLIHKGAKNDMKINNGRVLIDPFVYPKPQEQQKIANFLTLIDKKIENIKSKKEQLEKYKKGIMQKIFSQEIRFKDKNGKDFDEWKEKALGNCLDYIQPTNFLVSNTEYNNSYETPVLTAGKTFILGYTNEENGIFKDGLPVIIFDDFTTASKYVNFPFKAKSSAMKILISKNGNNIKFMFEVINNLNYTVQGHERHWIGKFSNFTSKIPTIKEQNKIIDFIDNIDSRIENETKKLEKAKEFKKGLLQQMFI